VGEISRSLALLDVACPMDVLVLQAPRDCEEDDVAGAITAARPDE
jgi:hypothetical protein